MRRRYCWGWENCHQSSSVSCQADLVQFGSELRTKIPLKSTWICESVRGNKLPKKADLFLAKAKTWLLLAFKCLILPPMSIITYRGSNCLQNVSEKKYIKYDVIREGLNNPGHRNFPLKRYPPPRASTDEIFPKSQRKKLTEKGRKDRKFLP